MIRLKELKDFLCAKIKEELHFYNFIHRLARVMKGIRLAISDWLLNISLGIFAICIIVLISLWTYIV